MKSHNTGFYVIIALAALGTLVLVLFRSSAVEVVYPFERAKHMLKMSVIPRLVGCINGGKVAAENVRMRREISSLALLRGEVDRLERENARLRRSLGYAERHRETHVAAEVIATGGGAAGAHDSVRVNRGSLDGVAEGAVVIVPDGLVGRVSSVTPHTAEIMLLTDPSLKVACEIETADGQPGITGILTGGVGDRLLLRYLCNLPDINRRVFTSGLGGVFPRGIVVGTLLTVTNRFRNVEGEVRPSVGYSTLEDVFIRREK